MSAINVRRDVKDSFYRYKMPRLIAKVEGKGNGIKTVIPNMTDIARALSRPSSYPTKFFGCVLGAQITCDDKNERYIVTGEHEAERLQQILDGFISKYVLCSSCLNPETDIIIKGNDIWMDCKACGARNMADMRHKLATFILKNPPEVAVKKQRKQRMAATAQANGANEHGMGESGAQDDEDQGSDDDLITQRINKEAAGLKLESKLAQEGWSEDTSDAAVAQRMKELNVKSSSFGVDDEEEGENKYEQFGEWLDSGSPSDDDIVAKAEELGVFGKYKAVQVLIQCIFDENMVTQIPKRTKLLHKFVKQDEKHQKAVLGGIERLVGNEHKEALLKKMPNILMALYKADILEDDVFIKWGEKPSKRYVDKEVSKEIKKAAKPFLEWLENASEEEESD
ncbi:domain found in IF2B/IF5-domain-containing protein [Spinellus fusiger]|nr:domain found in IF2B/IF5-domain-containing protein [Spinellus fusiger]